MTDRQIVRTVGVARCSSCPGSLWHGWESCPGVVSSSGARLEIVNVGDAPCWTGFDRDCVLRAKLGKMSADKLRAGITVVGPDGIRRNVMRAARDGDLIRYTAAPVGGDPVDFAVPARTQLTIVSYHND